MEGWLPVEDDQVIIPNVTLHLSRGRGRESMCEGGRRGGERITDADLVSELEVEVAGFRVVAKVNPFPIVSYDVLGPGVLVVATGNQLLHSEEQENISSTKQYSHHHA